MAKAGDIVESLTTRLVFLETAADTDGALLRFEQTVQAGAPRVAEHVHPWQEERFEVLAGQMGVRLHGVERVLQAGESVVIPRGARHQFWNAGTDELRQVVELRPANRTEAFFEQTFRMQGAGRISERGVPNPLLMAPVVLTGGVFLPGIPIPVQRVAFGLLAAVGRAIGHHPADGRTGPPRANRPSARTGGRSPTRLTPGVPKQRHRRRL